MPPYSNGNVHIPLGTVVGHLSTPMVVVLVVVVVVVVLVVVVAVRLVVVLVIVVISSEYSKQLYRLLHIT